mgnify:CR=1 FL=1
MSRYKNVNTRMIDGKSSKRYYTTTLYRTVIERDTDMYFIAQQGDRCDNLAQKFYGDPTLWWFIARANNMVTMNVEVGKTIRIPANTSKAKGK